MYYHGPFATTKLKTLAAYKILIMITSYDNENYTLLDSILVKQLVVVNYM